MDGNKIKFEIVNYYSFNFLYLNGAINVIIYQCRKDPKKNLWHYYHIKKIITYKRNK
jgi:hypothetical protein